MNMRVVNNLRRLITEQGTRILDDSTRMKAMIGDYTAGEPVLERKALGRCAEMGACKELKNAVTSDERWYRKAAIAERMHVETGIDREKCEEALDVLEMAVCGEVGVGKTCGECGMRLMDRAKYCGECGWSELGKGADRGHRQESVVVERQDRSEDREMEVYVPRTVEESRSPSEPPEAQEPAANTPTEEQLESSSWKTLGILVIVLFFIVIVVFAWKSGPQ